MRLVDLITLFAALSNFGLGLFVIFHNWRRPIYIAFSAFSFITGFWALTNFLFYYYPSRFLIESQYATGALVFPFAIVWFGLLLGKSLRRIHILLLSFLSFVVFVTPFVKNLLIEDFVIQSNHQYALKLTSFFNYYSLFPISVYILLVVWTIRAYIPAHGLRKLQLRYILAGAFFFGGISVIFSYILPLFNISLVAPVDAQSSLILVGFSTYAIIRHRLLDIRLVISRSILYFLLLAVVSLLFIVNIFLGVAYFEPGSAAQLVFALIAAIAVVFGLDPLKRYIAKLTDKVFFKAPIDYQEVLARLSEKTSLEVDLDSLVLGLPADLAKDLKLKHVEILLADDKGNLCRRDAVTSHLTICFGHNTPLVEHISEPGETIDRDGLERKIEDTRDGPEKATLQESLHQLQEVDGYYVAPVTAQSKLNAALVLGQKLSGDAFSVEELRLFKVLGPQIGSAIEKAKLFDEVKNFSQKLQIEVDRATKELKDRNRYLLALQEVTSLITHSLDYKKVTQEIVDGIAKKLGYVGGVLMLLDRATGVTWAEAVTDTPLTRMAFKLLPKPVNEYRGKIDDPDKASLAMRTGELQESAELEDFLNPPIPGPICKAIQKITRIRHVVAVPIFSEDDVIGAIVYVIGKGHEDITQQELAMMKSLADQAGIVIRNLRLFEAIQKANAELERANEHLRSLDQAKSEFISIASHQLRTPMTGIMGYLSMLVSGDFGKLDPKMFKILDGILGASKRMIRLINIFLNISKIEAGKFEISKKPTQLAEVIETEFVELSKLAKDKGLELSYKAPKTPLPLANVDRDKMADVIQNLVDNAIKYTEKGKITVSASASDDAVTISVNDTGRGLKKDEAEKLFQKFVRGDGIARIHPDGSGLGLYIAKKIVEAHGGHIWVESEGEGKGSTFTFVVPVDGGEE